MSVKVLILIIVYDYVGEYVLRKHILKGKWTWPPELKPSNGSKQQYVSRDKW